MRTRLPKPAPAPVKEEERPMVKAEAFVEVKQELVEVKAEAFDLAAGVSVGQVEVVGDGGYIKCNKCEYSTANVETLKRHVASLHSREVQAVGGSTKDSNPDQSKDPLLADFDLGKRKRTRACGGSLIAGR